MKNRTSPKFEYKENVSKVDRTEKGYLITFSNGSKYPYGTENVRFCPLVSRRENVRIYEKGKLNERYNTVDDYGRCLIFRKGVYSSGPIQNTADIEICDIKKNNDQAELLIKYFNLILNQNDQVSFGIPSEEANAKSSNQLSTELLQKAILNIDILDTRTVLSRYMDGLKPLNKSCNQPLVYPFGCNESQKLAVSSALSNSISIVEGPPGTGKTQTILNIIANLITQNKTVAIVSNNNSAVFNVREKLSKSGYDMMVASLGNKDNKTSFFDNLEEQTVHKDFKVSEEQLKSLRNDLENLDATLIAGFQNRNKLASLKTQLSKAEIQFNHIQAEQPLDHNTKTLLDKKFSRKLTAGRALKLRKLLSGIDIENKLSFINKLQLVLQYGMFDLNTVSQYGKDLYVYVNHKYYEQYIARVRKEISAIESWLMSNNETKNLNRYVDVSKKIFNATLYEKYSHLDKIEFSSGNYLRQFEPFISRYPVVLSSTLSLQASIPKGYLFDYLIIDEASQVDILKSAACFSCCRNAVIVGDSMQLTHIPGEKSNTVAIFEVGNRIHSAYAYYEKNILDSLKVLYKDNIASVLLKEHYRCHPLIIGFCNQKFYGNKLVIMTSGDNHPFRIIETNIAGGRSRYNQRQVDETDLYIRQNYIADYTKVGVVAPFRDHADMLKKQLPPGTEADTIHKFQGREKEVIVFNTVKGKIDDFINNPNLINVAVSRAEKEFIMVKPASMDLPHGTNLGDLIRYICYTTDPDETIIQGRIRSVFDLLYKEYNKEYNSFFSSGWSIKESPAEVIIHKLLRDKILIDNTLFSSIDMVREYRLFDLIQDSKLFSVDEIRFIRNNSRLDFLLYNKLDKTPVLAIEVDGVSTHDNSVQQKRDEMKDHILETIGLPLLRLSTDGHNEEVRIIERLKTAMGLDALS